MLNITELEIRLIIWGCSSVGRAPDLHSGGLGFNSPQLHIFILIFFIQFLFELYPFQNTQTSKYEDFFIQFIFV
jgi:hypothetical protein